MASCVYVGHKWLTNSWLTTCGLLTAGQKQKARSGPLVVNLRAALVQPEVARSWLTYKELCVRNNGVHENKAARAINPSHTRQENGITNEQHIATPSTNQHSVTGCFLLNYLKQEIAVWMGSPFQEGKDRIHAVLCKCKKAKDNAKPLDLERRRGEGLKPTVEEYCLQTFDQGQAMSFYILLPLTAIWDQQDWCSYCVLQKILYWLPIDQAAGWQVSYQAMIGERRVDMLLLSDAILLAPLCSATAVKTPHYLSERLDCSPPTTASLDSIPGRDTPGFSQVGIVPDDVAGQWVFLGDLPFPLPLHSGAAPFSPHCTLIGSQDLVSYPGRVKKRMSNDKLIAKVHVFEVNVSPNNKANFAGQVVFQNASIQNHFRDWIVLIVMLVICLPTNHGRILKSSHRVDLFVKNRWPCYTILDCYEPKPPNTQLPAAKPAAICEQEPKYLDDRSQELVVSDPAGATTAKFTVAH
ncbi:hypothetical protein PR048_001452 [Dryococelus australis]|uniref:Uncharacterized protein n=1 Tax=Dryococelus australis TaxID=614101 RepID=A0ABQ9IIW0_9NEOP|nr:hypothetical protein PR048_001452 [Dryococelus australis]